MKIKCERCGNCCEQPDTIRVLQTELIIIADYLKITLDEVVQKYTIPYPADGQIYTEPVFSLQTPCLFYNDAEKKCMIHDIKPLTCGHFPYGLLEDKKDFLEIMYQIKDGKLQNADCQALENCKALERLSKSPIGRLQSFEKEIVSEMVQIGNEHLLNAKRFFMLHPELR